MIALIGLLVIAIALVALATWRGAMESRAVALRVAASLVVFCVLLVVYVLCFGEAQSVRPRHAGERLIEPVVLPLFVLLPAMVTFCVAQWLRHRGRSVRYVRVAAAITGAAVCGVTPFGAVMTGCGLAGVCF